MLNVDDYITLLVLSVDSLTRVNPLVIHVYWFGQKVYGCLKVLQTYSALDSGRIFGFVHFHFTTFLVVTKWACEHHVQGLNGFVLWWRLPLGFSTAHSFVLLSVTTDFLLMTNSNICLEEAWVIYSIVVLHTSCQRS